MTLLKTENFVKELGGLVVTDDVNLTVEEDKRVSIIGPNGTRKSTFISLITRRLSPTSGDTCSRDESIAGLRSHQVVQRGVSKSLQTTSISPDLTVKGNAEIAALVAERGASGFEFLRHRDSLTGIYGVTRDTLDSVGLLDRADTIAIDLPYGDKCCLGIGIALTSEPDLLLMDGPIAGMFPEETKSTVDLIERVKRDHGLTLVLIEHDMEIVFSISDRVVVLSRGGIIAEGTPDETQGNGTVQEAYLGGVEL